MRPRVQSALTEKGFGNVLPSSSIQPNVVANLVSGFRGGRSNFFAMLPVGSETIDQRTADFTADHVFRIQV